MGDPVVHTAYSPDGTTVCSSMEYFAIFGLLMSHTCTLLSLAKEQDASSFS